jgi:hypothetical protein
MIVVDTSAFLAIVLGEPEGRQCFDALTVADGIAISAGTLAEALIVSGRRGAAERLKTLTANLGTEVVPVTEDMAGRSPTPTPAGAKASAPPASTSATVSPTPWQSSAPVPSSSSVETLPVPTSSAPWTRVEHRRGVVPRCLHVAR